MAVFDHFWHFFEKNEQFLKIKIFRNFAQKWYFTSSLRICEFLHQIVKLLEPKKHVIGPIRPKIRFEKKFLKSPTKKNDPVSLPKIELKFVENIGLLHTKRSQRVGYQCFNYDKNWAKI